MGCLVGRTPFRGVEVQVRSPARRTLWWSVSGVPVHDEIGLHVGWRGVVRLFDAAMGERMAERHLIIHELGQALAAAQRAPARLSAGAGLPVRCSDDCAGCCRTCIPSAQNDRLKCANRDNQCRIGCGAAMTSFLLSE
jgi:hypothetical protein